MQPSDAKRFRDLLRGMGRMYGTEPDALVLDAYWVALSSWTLEDFQAACAQLMKTAKFMPRPADFTELRNAERMTAGEAWALVLAHVRNGGAYLPACEHDGVRDPLVLAAVRAIGGFQAVAMSRTDQTPYLERRFAEHYESISEREDIREALPQIAGPSRARVSGPRQLVDLGHDPYNEPAP